MKIHVGIQNSRIETDNPKLLQALYELYSFKIPGAEYSAAYKRRQWDGKTHFISKSGVFKNIPYLLKYKCVSYSPFCLIDNCLNFVFEIINNRS